MSALQRVAGKIAGAAERDINRLWARVTDGDLTVRVFVPLAGLVIARANQRAISAADLTLAVMLAQMLGEPVAPVGLGALEGELDQMRHRDAVATVIDADVEFTGEALAASQGVRLARLARAEPLSSAQDALSRGMQEHGVAGWVRETDPDPCPLCRQWADGVIRKPTVRFARHTACACVQVPVL